jgi:hypothetical protein
MAAPPAAPPQVGVPVSKESLNAKLGANAQAYKKAVFGLADQNDWAAGYTAEQLVDLYGFTLDEANLFKSAMTEVQPLVDQLNALQWLPRCWGA